ncbi:hypothetical protein ACFXTH_018004 [Malus domestica]
MEIPEEKKVKLVTCKLKSGPSAWWEQLQISQTRQRKTHVYSWMKMKPLLKARFYLLIMNKFFSNNTKSASRGVELSKPIQKSFTD